MIVVYKEPGYTSSDAVAKLRGILHMKRIGHTGTLDPAAEGVLPVCLGYATRLCDLIAARDKEYEAVLRLGVCTDTQDMTGTVLDQMTDESVRSLLEAKAAASGTDAAGLLSRTVRGFTGTILQRPPRYSAIWVQGKRAYALAREGVDFELPAREVTIRSIEITNIALPLVSLRVVCSPGTYIRTLCEDIGKALGTGGAMEHLTRTRVGTFTLERARTLGEIETLFRNDPDQFLKEYLYPVDFFFADAPAVTVREEAMPYLRNGNPLSEDNLACSSGWDAIQTASLPQAAPIAPAPGGKKPAEGLSPDGRGPRQENYGSRRGDLIRVYGSDGDFYGVYRYDAERQRLVCVKMFHEVAGARTS